MVMKYNGGEIVCKKCNVAESGESCFACQMNGKNESPLATKEHCKECGTIYGEECKCPNVSDCEINELSYGGAYNFKNQPERLEYIGKNKSWHQFAIIGSPGVWCELLDSDLHLIEKTKEI